MDDQEVRARAEIQATMARYVRFVDIGRPDELARLFTTPMVYDMGAGNVVRSPEELITAVEALKETFSNSPGLSGRLRHHVSSVVIEFDGPKAARATSAFQAISAAGLDHWGVYKDELVPVGEQWLFTRRAVVLEGATDASPMRDQL
jgi:hypothetical protein